MSTFLIYLFLGYFVNGGSPSCPDIQVEHKIQKINGSYQIELKEKGGLAPYTYALFDEKGLSINNDFRFKSNKIDIDKKGTYHAVVFDKNGCSGRITLEID